MKDWKFVDVGNIKVMNAYGWMESHGHLEYYNPDIPFGGHTKGFVEKSKNGYIGAKTNGSVIISKKEFSTEQEAKKYVENKKVGNERILNAFSESFEFYKSAGESDLKNIKEQLQKEGGWTNELKERAKKTADSLDKKAKEIIKNANSQANELEKIATQIRSL